MHTFKEIKFQPEEYMIFAFIANNHPIWACKGRETRFGMKFHG